MQARLVEEKTSKSLIRQVLVIALLLNFPIVVHSIVFFLASFHVFDFHPLVILFIPLFVMNMYFHSVLAHKVVFILFVLLNIISAVIGIRVAYTRKIRKVRKILFTSYFLLALSTWLVFFIVTTQAGSETKAGQKGFPLKADCNTPKTDCPFLRAVEI